MDIDGVFMEDLAKNATQVHKHVRFYYVFGNRIQNRL